MPKIGDPQGRRRAAIEAGWLRDDLPISLPEPVLQVYVKDDCTSLADQAPRI